MAKAKGTYDKTKDFGASLQKFEQYLTDPGKEKARQQYLYPLFQQVYGDAFKIESDASNADGYVEGRLIVESKSEETQWVEGFYQALHYEVSKGLTFTTIMVVARKFVAFWHTGNLPEYAVRLAKTTSPLLAPSEAGRENARKTSAASKAEIQNKAIYWLDAKALQKGPGLTPGRSLYLERYAILDRLRNLEQKRVRISQQNFIDAIERLKSYFRTPNDAVHAFYTILPYWDVSSTLTERRDEVFVTGGGGNKASDYIKGILPGRIEDLRTFIQQNYVWTNHGSGLTHDYYFSRFDEVMARIVPDYVKQHGIFFTDANLSRFALWYAAETFLKEKIAENYIVFDPAGGSGNLVYAWRQELKQKVISELQPDLLTIIERRMKADIWHVQHGFTIVPRTSTGEGLNFLNRPAAAYLELLEKEMRHQHPDSSLNKPIAFLLNPPYKNTDERTEARVQTQAHYEIDPAILALTGHDAGRERYLAFLGQIILMARHNSAQLPPGSAQPLVMVFTPTSWLVPRPTYRSFRQHWDAAFEYVGGFMVTSNAFFKLDGRWPLAFTMWRYAPKEGRRNEVQILDLTHFTTKDFDGIYWDGDPAQVKLLVGSLLQRTNTINLGRQRVTMPQLAGQGMYDFKRDPTKAEINSGLVIGGLPLNDARRSNSKTYGICNGPYIGFMDDATPVRIKQDNGNRLSTEPDRVWFRLDSVFKDRNKCKSFNGPPDNRGYCAYDMATAISTTNWFSVAKIIDGYPASYNQMDLWAPSIPENEISDWHACCFALVLAENRCVVTRFEADNPVPGAPEVFVNNPMCPTLPQSFYARTLSPIVQAGPPPALRVHNAITHLYTHWALVHCQGQPRRENVGLSDEPYFRYFSYPDFITPFSGLVQIRKYAEIHQPKELLDILADVAQSVVTLKRQMYQKLVVEWGYFS